ncbi:MAG TPA: MMPL family transporter, partial [Acidimicrobiales bacterium]|nr:MMPL family transporter [Acidimicrobiales bacterium]
MAATVDAAERSPGVFAVGEPSVNEAGDTAVVPVIPESGPASEETDDLVDNLRSDVVPATEASTGAEISIAGPTAANIDLTDKVGGALPTLMAIVIGLTMLLLLVFCSVLVTIKAAFGILLSIG